MTFLQPLLLLGLPLIGLPILIHLIHRQRHHTIRWAAMMFLLDARRMAHRMARLRQWLIMAMRMMAVGGLILAIARPLASGALGLAMGGQPDTTIILLDRSASMEQQSLETGESKRSTGLDKLSELIETVGPQTRTVLIENTRNQAEEISHEQPLTRQPWTTATATAADIPAMMQTALDYVVANQTGRTDIWICSDLRENDWKPDDGRWAAVREGFQGLEGSNGIRIYLLSYPSGASDNVAVRVTVARRRQIGQSSQLVLDIELTRDAASNQPLKVPVEIVIGGARSVVNIDIRESTYVLQGHTVPLDHSLAGGWGWVEIPNDGNPQDNISYFVFAEPPEHHTVIVSDDRRCAEPLRLAAVSPSDPTLKYTATVLASASADEIPWETASAILWQAPLPDGPIAQHMQNFVASGRPILFFPAEQPGTNTLFGARWGEWQQAPGDSFLRVESWRGDSDLLRHTQSGQPLPVGQLGTHRYCTFESQGPVLARLQGGAPLLRRVGTEGEAAYFCATLPQAAYSSLAQDGVVFYVMIHRALAAGARTLGAARQWPAGSLAARRLADWRWLSTLPDDVLSSERPFHAGTLARDEQFVALNRPPGEDLAETLDDAAIDRLLSGLNYRQVLDQIGSTGSLASEIWRAFLYCMAVALLVEAWLCLPDKAASKKFARDGWGVMTRETVPQR